MLNISDDTFYFCTFNQHSKVDPVIFDRWMSILRRTPHAKLWMQQVQPVAPAGAAYYRAYAALAGRSQRLQWSVVGDHSATALGHGSYERQVHHSFAQAYIMERAKANGIGEDRFFWSTGFSEDQHMEIKNLADLFLDTITSGSLTAPAPARFPRAAADVRQRSRVGGRSHWAVLGCLRHQRESAGG